MGRNKTHVAYPHDDFHLAMLKIRIEGISELYIYICVSLVRVRLQHQFSLGEAFLNRLCHPPRVMNQAKPKHLMKGKLSSI